MAEKTPAQTAAKPANPNSNKNVKPDAVNDTFTTPHDNINQSDYSPIG